MLYVGIDIGKLSHVAALLSPELLEKYKKYDACPTQKVEQSRTGFVALLALLHTYAPSEECHVLMEHTGHYGFPLEQFLQENGITVYRMVARKRYSVNKTDTKDARAMAVLLYNQVELRVPLVDETERVHPIILASKSASLRGLAQHRYELSHEVTRRKNKLKAICDELFPELTQVYKDPNTDSALNLRNKYPTPQAVAEANVHELAATRLRTQPSTARLVELQTLAKQSIGTKDVHRRTSLVFEQRLLIAELQLLNNHVAELDMQIGEILSTSRDGQILTSFTGVGTVQAAMILSTIGSIANFDSAAKLRGYMGWSPRQSQTGSTYDSTTLNRAGNVLLKQTMYLVTIAAVSHDPRWKALYDRRVKETCAYDARTGKYKGKMKVIGRCAGQIIGVMYTLLRKDYDLLATLPEGEIAPPPELYSVESRRRE